MKKIKLLIIISVSFASAMAQTRSHAMYFELGGIGLPYSFSYDTRFVKGKPDGPGGRIGFGAMANEDIKILSIPLQLNYLFGRERNFFEIGIGATFLSYQDDYGGYYQDYQCDMNGCFPTGKYYAGHFILPLDDKNNIMGTLNFGYRRQPIKGGFTWRASINPVFNNNGFWPFYGGIAVGYKFEK